MLHTYLPDNTVKLRFTSIFDDAAVPVITHDFNAKTLRLGPGYSILDENGDPLGAGGGGGGISGTISANQVAFGAGADEIEGDPDFTFEDFGVGRGILMLREKVLSDAMLSTSLNYWGLQIEGTFSEIINTQINTSDSNALTATKLTSLRVDAGASGTLTDLVGIEVTAVAGATNNYAIKTGAGDIRHGTLAGSGTRYVLCDDDGNLVAGDPV